MTLVCPTYTLNPLSDRRVPVSLTATGAFLRSVPAGPG